MSVLLLGLLCLRRPFLTICSSWSKSVYKLRTSITFLPYRTLCISPRIKKDESTYSVFILPHDASIPLNISQLGLQAQQMISSFMYLFKWYTIVPVTVTPLLALPFCNRVQEGSTSRTAVRKQMWNFALQSLWDMHFQFGFYEHWHLHIKHILQSSPHQQNT